MDVVWHHSILGRGDDLSEEQAQGLGLWSAVPQGVRS